MKLYQNDARIIRTLRTQVDSLTMKFEESNSEITSLKSSLASREQELRRNIRTINTLENRVNNDPTVDNHDEAHSTLGQTPLEQLEAVDVANRRLIDQLNGQVDFLNDQLATKEAQIKDMTALTHSAEQLKYDVSVKNDTILSLKNEQNRLITQLRMMHEQLQSVGENVLDSKVHSSNYTAIDDYRQSDTEDEEERIAIDEHGPVAELEAIRRRVSITSASTPANSNNTKSASTPPAAKSEHGKDHGKEVLVWKAEVKMLKGKISQLESQNKQ